MPAEISVETHWFSDVRVAAAASLRAVMSEGPGKMWAFTRGAQVAMRWWPEEYCFWTVSGGLDVVSFLSLVLS